VAKKTVTTLQAIVTEIATRILFLMLFILRENTAQQGCLSLKYRQPDWL
jgi:hypothetical protein